MIAAAFHLDPADVLASDWFTWRVRNAAFDLYVESLPPPPPPPPPR